MKATVKYNEDGEPFTFEVSERRNHTVKFHMNGSTAVANMVEPMEGSNVVYVDSLSRYMDFAESLPFVQAVEIDEYEPPEGDE